MVEKFFYFYTARTSSGQFCSGLIGVPKDTENPPSVAFEEAKRNAEERLSGPFAISDFRRVD